MDHKSSVKAQTQAEIVARQSARDPEIICETAYYQSGNVWLSIDVYRPNAEKYPGVRPGILFFFGGGFRVGTPLAFREQALICAKQGYVAFSADYRIASLFDVTAEDSIRDGALAWQYVRNTADEWQVDPDRIVLAGGSAGATIASMCGPLTGKYPAGLVLFNPGVLDRAAPQTALNQLLDWEMDGIPITCTTSVQAGMPPMLVMHGEQDQIIPASTIRSYVEHARAQGVDAKLIIYPNVTHGFFNFNRSRAHFLLTMGETLLFLEKLFAAPDNNA